MSLRKLKFALFGNEYQVRKSTVIVELLHNLHKHGAEVLIESNFYDYLTRIKKIDLEGVGVFEHSDFGVDYVISIGGDGTFLRAADCVKDKNIPIIGVNTGRLGFLADVLPSEVDNAIRAIYNNDYSLEEHTVIRIVCKGNNIDENYYALNDIAVLKKDDASMITIKASIDGEELVTYRADGLIVTTATGSTAYSLSNGGPIISPEASVLCLTPVAAHSLTVRPIVVSDRSVITLNVRSRSHNFLAAIDGHSKTLPEGTEITISKAHYSVKIVKKLGQRYFSTLRDKMMWGADNRL